ncbi:hypothetical protein [Asticcacaulis sp. YBE204]|uniref:hypothetical protein n=1 Tax=Asticcacaulis sp. YBE204 TaxID=1282363 RepID=UPI0003C3C658|nr:hypothetical protein [Asticcacaulis sp. YBE204]ESQ79614.1 hypothetical protein AEYBE204_07165 [Asticcacaulis sp. YBE204]
MSHMPPIPPASRSPNGPADAHATNADPNIAHDSVNPDQKGQSANTKINTTHSGNQQDR